MRSAHYNKRLQIWLAIIAASFGCALIPSIAFEDSADRIYGLKQVLYGLTSQEGQLEDACKATQRQIDDLQYKLDTLRNYLADVRKSKLNVEYEVKRGRS